MNKTYNGKIYLSSGQFYALFKLHQNGTLNIWEHNDDDMAYALAEYLNFKRVTGSAADWIITNNVEVIHK